MNLPRIRIAADVGGTFTDLVAVGDDGMLETRKVSSTPEDYSIGVIQGVSELLENIGREMSEIEALVHGCTVATNAILQANGARTALITTKGFRDVLELRRVRVPRLYDPTYVKPRPLVPRELRFEVTERLDHRGNVVRPLDLDELRDVIARIAESGATAVAVCLLHSYANPAHERVIGEAVAEALPGCFVSLSVDVLPEIREYERTSTTVINSYVGPPVEHYLRSLQRSMLRAGVDGPLLIMHSNGGILQAETVIRKPAQIIECGPAAGVIASDVLARRMGIPNAITFDMGGTTAKASIIEKGRLLRTDEYEVGGGISLSNPLLNGAGYALKLPVIDISEVGAGGGSMVTIDKAGALKVGPESAGAAPGPICYGAGGTRVTVTDANVVLGYLNPESLAGGTVPIHFDAAFKAVEDQVAEPLGVEVADAAYGVYLVTTANMMRAIKAVSTHRGRDPRDFSMIAFGGNGGIFATQLAGALQMERVIIPPAAGVFSAVGLLDSDIQATESRAFLRDLREVAEAGIEELFDELQSQVAEQLGAPPDTIDFRRAAMIRYAGQAFELEIPFEQGASPDAVADRFEVEHESTYGHRFSGDMSIQVVGLRVSGTLRGDKPLRLAAGVRDEGKARGERNAYFGASHGWIATPVLRRSDLSQELTRGPIIVEEYEGTTVVGPTSGARLDGLGNIVIEVTL